MDARKKVVWTLLKKIYFSRETHCTSVQKTCGQTALPHLKVLIQKQIKFNHKSDNNFIEITIWKTNEREIWVIKVLLLSKYVGHNNYSLCNKKK